MSEELYTRSDNGNETTVSIRKKLDVTNAPQLFDLIAELEEDVKAKKVSTVIVDLKELELIDSSGVAAIVGLYKRTKKLGGTVKITEANGQPLAIFKLLRMDRVWGLE
ncbi:MAG: STAS domain-containing protein [Proteobacteria bacterium]|nr:STAS domain-containing protein [Pseudomonadota bacterium]